MWQKALQLNGVGGGRPIIIVDYKAGQTVTVNLDFEPNRLMVVQKDSNNNASVYGAIYDKEANKTYYNSIYLATFSITNSTLTLKEKPGRPGTYYIYYE